jgi:archaeosine-15-forming tRNA-guanine transglycosylase
MDERIDKLPISIRDLVTDRAQDGAQSLGAAIGGIVDDVLADGWTYEKEADAFVKDGKRVMVKVVWRALVEARA